MIGAVKVKFEPRINSIPAGPGLWTPDNVPIPVVLIPNSGRESSCLVDGE